MAYKPFRDSIANRSILFDEICIYLLNINLILFSNLIPDSDKFAFGWLSIGLLLGNLGGNLILLLYLTI